MTDTPLPYVVFRLSGLKSHERSIWLRSRSVETLTVRGIEMVNTGDTEQVAGQECEVWTPRNRLDEWKKGHAA